MDSTRLVEFNAQIMTAGHSKKERTRRARRVLREINRILLQEWDPICAKDETYAQDEYETYAPSVYRVLLDGASEEEIAAHLRKIETEQMGLIGGDPSKIRSHLAAVAASLKAVDLGRES